MERGTPSRSHSSFANDWKLPRSAEPEGSQRLMKSDTDVWPGLAVDNEMAPHSVSDGGVYRKISRRNSVADDSLTARPAGVRGPPGRQSRRCGTSTQIALLNDDC